MNSDLKILKEKTQVLLLLLFFQLQNISSSTTTTTWLSWIFIKSKLTMFFVTDCSFRSKRSITHKASI